MPNAIAKAIAPSASSIVGDRAKATDAGTEIAADKALQVVPVLHRQRLVEPVLMVDLLDQRRGGALTQLRLGHRSRQRPDPGEDEDREPEQDGDE
jgi:hypothetical protein